MKRIASRWPSSCAWLSSPPPVAAAAAAATAGGEPATKGPITIWYSNNAEEVAWGKQMVAAWNAAHPTRRSPPRRSRPARPPRRSSAPRSPPATRPCLIFNTSPAAVPQFQKQGGLVPLDDFTDGKRRTSRHRTGDIAEQYKSPDGKYYQLPWKSNPVMIFYNKRLFAKAGIDPENPPLATYDEFLATSASWSPARRRQAAIYPAPSSEFFQSWFDFYPLFAAETGGKQLVEDGKATFDDAGGQGGRGLLGDDVRRSSRRKEKYTGDAFADGKAAMAIVGPWAIAVYKGKVDWGVVPVPTSGGQAARARSTPSPTRRTSRCTPPARTGHRVGRAEVRHQQGAGRQVAGGDRPDAAAHGPRGRLRGLLRQRTRTTRTFADQAARTVEVPNVPNSIEIWQTFRDAYSKSVIFGKQPGDDGARRGRHRRSTHSPSSPDMARDAMPPAPRPVSGAAPQQAGDRARPPAGRASRSSRRTSCSSRRCSPTRSGSRCGCRFHDYFFAAPGAIVDRPFVGFDNYVDGADRPRRPAVVLQRRRSSWSSTCR